MNYWERRQWSIITLNWWDSLDEFINDIQCLSLFSKIFKKMWYDDNRILWMWTLIKNIIELNPINPNEEITILEFLSDPAVIKCADIIINNMDYVTSNHTFRKFKELFKSDDPDVLTIKNLFARLVELTLISRYKFDIRQTKDELSSSLSLRILEWIQWKKYSLLHIKSETKADPYFRDWFIIVDSQNNKKVFWIFWWSMTDIEMTFWYIDFAEIIDSSDIKSKSAITKKLVKTRLSNWDNIAINLEDWTIYKEDWTISTTHKLIDYWLFMQSILHYYHS